MSDQGGYPPTGDPWGRDAGWQSPYGGRPVPPYDPPPPPGTPDHGGQYGQPYQQSPYQQPQQPYQGPYQQPSQQPVPYGQVVPYGQPVYYGAPGAGGETDGMAVASMICGIASILVLCCAVALTPFALLGVAVGGTAVALGFVSRKRIAESGGARTGDGMALAGLICGFCGAGLGLIGVVAAALWFGFALTMY